MDNQSRFGRQPFVALIASSGASIAGTARQLGFDQSYVMRVAKGRVRPSVELQDALATHFERDKHELFTAKALAVEYQARSNNRGFREVG